MKLVEPILHTFLRNTITVVMLVLLLLLVSRSAFAQSDEYSSRGIRFTHLPIADGLSQSCVVIFVRDNSIGFDTKHADKLSAVFQKLGRGVDRGATFYFALHQSDRAV